MEAIRVYKVCKVCEQSKLATTEFFYSNGQGCLSSECKICKKERTTAWKARNPEKLAAQRDREAPARRERALRWYREHRTDEKV